MKKQNMKGKLIQKEKKVFALFGRRQTEKLS
jgi:hypothetical protein